MIRNGSDYIQSETDGLSELILPILELILVSVSIQFNRGSKVDGDFFLISWCKDTSVLGYQGLWDIWKIQLT
jgi:hypothetical protein